MDVELAGQMLALLSANASRGVEAQVQAGVLAGNLSQTGATGLLAAYRLCWRLQAAGRLLAERGVDLATLGEGGRAFVLRETGFATGAALLADLTAATAVAAEVIRGLMQDGGERA